MKKILSLLVIFAALSITACKNEKKDDKSPSQPDAAQKVEDPSKPAQAQTAAVVAHACGADCKDGQHAYAHNEVGHTCTEACGTAHVCGTKCKDGKHEYAHGEAGHQHTEECMKM